MEPTVADVDVVVSTILGDDDDDDDELDDEDVAFDEILVIVGKLVAADVEPSRMGFNILLLPFDVNCCCC